MAESGERFVGVSTPVRSNDSRASSAVTSGASFSLTNPYIAAAKMSSVRIAFTVTTSNDKFRPVEELAACSQPRVAWLQQRERKWLVLPKSPAKVSEIVGLLDVEFRACL